MGSGANCTIGCGIQNLSDLLLQIIPCADCTTAGTLENITDGERTEARLVACVGNRIELKCPARFAPGTAVQFACGSLFALGEVVESAVLDREILVSIAVSHVFDQRALSLSLAPRWPASSPGARSSASGSAALSRSEE